MSFRKAFVSSAFKPMSAFRGERKSARLSEMSTYDRKRISDQQLNHATVENAVARGNPRGAVFRQFQSSRREILGRADGLFVEHPLIRKSVYEGISRIAKLRIVLEHLARQDIAILSGHRRALRQMGRNGVRGIAAEDDTAAKERPRQQHQLDRAVDNIGIRVERGRDIGDVAAILGQALSE